MNENEKILVFLGCTVLLVGIVSALGELGTQKRLPSLERRRTRINDRTGSRDSSGSDGGIKKVENESSPKYFTKPSSTMSRSTGAEANSKFFTSMKTGKLKTPSNILAIRKYPEDYYTLSKKAQWKFRQRTKLHSKSA